MGPERLSKTLKKQLADLVCKAHETVLCRELESLSQDFDLRRDGGIDSFDLADRIHKFHDGPARDSYKRFTWTRNADLPILVAAAVVDGILEEDEAPAEIHPMIATLRGPQGLAC